MPVLWDIRFVQRRAQARVSRGGGAAAPVRAAVPEDRNVYTHGIPPQALNADGSIPDEIMALLHEPNVTLELLFPLLYGAIWEYPYAEAQPIIRTLYEKLGASKLLWGSDMPNVERSCTYRQTLTYLTRHCSFISAADLDRIVGGNANELYFGE